MGKNRGRLAILDRAYDKSVKGQVLAELESSVLIDAIRYSAKKAKLANKPYRDMVWHRFGWDTPEGEARWNKIKQEIIYGKPIREAST